MASTKDNIMAILIIGFSLACVGTALGIILGFAYAAFHFVANAML